MAVMLMCPDLELLVFAYFPLRGLLTTGSYVIGFLSYSSRLLKHSLIRVACGLVKPSPSVSMSAPASLSTLFQPML